MHTIFYIQLYMKYIVPKTKSNFINYRILGHENTAKIINEINLKLQPLYMIIKCMNCEVTGQLYWVWASTVPDNIAR